MSSNQNFLKPGDEDTVCAVSTPTGNGGIAVIRVSGAKAAAITRKYCRFLPENPESHRLYFGLFNDLDGQPVDEVLVSFFADGRSFTGEQTTEVSCHGGSVTTASVLAALIEGGCRLARPGEFTYRAFMNGKLDLVQAESVLSLIESQSRQSARAALRQLQGHLSVEFARIEDDLLWILAQLEANIDFSSEGLEITSSGALSLRTDELTKFVAQLISTYRRGRLLREGLEIALAGKPNAGKSSLLNALLKEERAIVTDEPGTTRDTIEGRLVIDGIPVTFIDTAGLRVAESEVERIGIERSRKTVKNADFVFYVVDLGAADWREQFLEFAHVSSGSGPETFFLFNKTDLSNAQVHRAEAEAVLRASGLFEKSLWVSAMTGDGLPEILSFLEARVGISASDSSAVVTQARHLELLQKIHSCATSALALIKSDSSPEFIAFEFQEAIRAVHELLGKEFHEQVIDRIFKEFCLGK